MTELIDPKVKEPQVSEERYGVRVHKEIRYKEGFEDNIVQFDIFTDTPIANSHGFSWGDGTMSFKWNNGDSEEVIRERITKFLKPLGINYGEPPGVIHMTGLFEGSHLQTEEVDRQTLLQNDTYEAVEYANIIIISDTEVPVIIRPGDCNISIIYGKTEDGKDIIAKVHSSGESVNAGLPRHAIEHLKRLKVVQSSIRIGITPGISSKYYGMSEADTKIEYDEDGNPKGLRRSLVEANWKKHLAPKNPNLSNDQKRSVDILGATIMQYIEEGIEPSQIEAYDVDTYEAMKKGVGFSFEYNLTLGGRQDTGGRYMVAVQLQKAA